jgi:hypothetical protein
MIRHNGPEVFQTPVRDYPRSASVANLLRFSICCRGSRCDRFSMKALRIFVYCSVAAVILGVFNIWGGLQLYDAARSYNWPHVTGRVIASIARSKLMGRFDNWYRPRECSPHVFGRLRIGIGAASSYVRPAANLRYLPRV